MDSTITVAELLKKSKVIFWDFDGVIKESVEIKTNAFQKLFEKYGTEVIGMVRLHHENNGGMSRFHKMPIYMRYAGLEVTQEKVIELCENFGRLVFDGVVNAPWIPGVESYIRNNINQQIFIMVSATPQEELNEIVNKLNLRDCFRAIYGAPLSKAEAIKKSLNSYSITESESLMIGDASADLDAAIKNNIPFILRKHSSNWNLSNSYNGLTINDFENL
jgi:phosphoglycolate phosphatase-like HAD superfamily hydrolase